MKLALTIGGTEIPAPNGIPTGGLFTAGQNIIQLLFGLAFFFAAIVALFALVYAGYNWMEAGGDKQKLVVAKETIIYVIIGLIVIFLSFLIINLIGGFFGVKLVGS